MVTTKRCCWGKGKLDSRYQDELLKSLRELKESGKKSRHSVSKTFTRHRKVYALAGGLLLLGFAFPSWLPCGDILVSGMRIVH